MIQLFDYLFMSFSIGRCCPIQVRRLALSCLFFNIIFILCGGFGYVHSSFVTFRCGKNTLVLAGQSAQNEIVVPFVQKGRMSLLALCTYRFGKSLLTFFTLHFL